MYIGQLSLLQNGSYLPTVRYSWIIEETAKTILGVRSTCLPGYSTLMISCLCRQQTTCSCVHCHLGNLLKHMAQFRPLSLYMSMAHSISSGLSCLTQLLMLRTLHEHRFRNVVKICGIRFSGYLAALYLMACMACHLIGRSVPRELGNLPGPQACNSSSIEAQPPSVARIY